MQGLDYYADTGQFVEDYALEVVDAMSTTGTVMPIVSGQKSQRARMISSGNPRTILFGWLWIQSRARIIQAQRDKEKVVKSKEFLQEIL